MYNFEMVKAITLLVIILSASLALDCYDESGSQYCSTTVRYLLYDVNPPEGFNLRRDVYMRMAILVTELQKFGRWVLVLPPWSHLYHWRSHVSQDRLMWSLFFDIGSLEKFVPVVEMVDFLYEAADSSIDQVYVLQHFEDMFKSGKFEDKMQFQACNNPLKYAIESDGRIHGDFWGFDEITAGNVTCLSYHGHSSMIAPLLHKSAVTSIMLDHAEVALHDSFGDAKYWRARRSMRFAKQLRDKAAEFREQSLNSTDSNDRTFLPTDWTREKPKRSAIGGPYICVHLRRRDFVAARSKEIPSLKSAAQQIVQAATHLKLDRVFVATDAPHNEKEELRQILLSNKIKMMVFESPSLKYNDGQVAIIEQIICSHARKFYGTHESTFSFRIQEEREILGFPADTTFNRLCGDQQNTCQQPSRWLIQF